MPRLVVISHKPCWPSDGAASGFATDGGFPFQMDSLSQLFDATSLVVPVSLPANRPGEAPLTGNNLTIQPLTLPRGRGLARKLGFPLWLLRSLTTLTRAVWRADFVHTPIPGDIGTIGMLLATLLGKPLFVRHCGNWLVQKTAAEHFWRWFIERFAGGRNVMLVTGGNDAPPSTNPAVTWIFSSSLTDQQLRESRRQHEYPQAGRVRLIIACRQDRAKGTGVVIESLPIILRDYPAATLDVLGDGGDLKEFQAQAARLQLSDRINFHGKVDHKTVLRLFQQADLFCYPTAASEGFPKVVLEALAAGLPVITTPVSVLPKLIGAGGGILIEQPCPVALAAAVREVLANSKSYCEISERALATASQYSLEAWRDTIGALLRRAWGPLRSDD